MATFLSSLPGSWVPKDREGQTWHQRFSSTQHVSYHCHHCHHFIIIVNGHHHWQKNRLEMSEQEEVLMAEYRQGWASRAAQVTEDLSSF